MKKSSMKKLLKNNRLIFWTVTVVLIVTAVIIVYFSAIFPAHQEISDSQAQADAKIIGEYMLDNIDNGNFSVGERYYMKNENNNRSDYIFLESDNAEVNQSMKNRNFIYAYVLNENSVLISEGAVFQQVSGFLITKGNIEIPTLMQVPHTLGYDGDSISIAKNIDGVYLWTAGL